MTERPPLFVGNWKMNKSTAQTNEFISAFLELAGKLPPRARVAIAPPFTALATASAALRANQYVALAAQTMSEHACGAFTGEICAAMLAEFNVRYVILGHSERRVYQHESDAVIAAKLRAALHAEITPILAVGETLAIREEGLAVVHVLDQVRAAITGLDSSQLARLVIAYEPIWAIGTGQNCDADQAQSIASHIRTSHRGLADVSILYGGSMNPGNAKDYMSRPDIDGGLIGGASLDAATFATLIASGVHE